MSVINQGKWICANKHADDAAAGSRLVYFRKEVSFSDTASKIPVRISADGRYKLYVNGALVCFGPCKGDDKRRYADEPDLRPYLQTGRNVLAVELLCVGRDAWNSNHSLFTSGLHALYLEGIAAEGWQCRVCDTVCFLTEEEGFSPLHIHEKSIGMDLPYTINK